MVGVCGARCGSAAESSLVTHTATVVLDDQNLAGDVLTLRPGKILTTGERSFREQFGTPSSLELDILTLASAIYASDLAFKREERSNYPRNKIKLTVPVVNRRAFQTPDVAMDLIRYGRHVSVTRLPLLPV